MVDDSTNEGVTRRDFLTVTAGGVAAVGAACAMWPFVASLNPSQDVLALSSIEVDLSNIKEGQTLVVKWRGKPVFIRNRTPIEVEEARQVTMSQLPDPQTDQQRTKKGHEQWLVIVGVCTHLGCVPLDRRGDFDGWFCPCHGSQYDSSGRVRQGPAPSNMEVPPYEFISDSKIIIG